MLWKIKLKSFFTRYPINQPDGGVGLYPVKETQEIVDNLCICCIIN